MAHNGKRRSTYGAAVTTKNVDTNAASDEGGRGETSPETRLERETEGAPRLERETEGAPERGREVPEAGRGVLKAGQERP